MDVTIISTCMLCEGNTSSFPENTASYILASLVRQQQQIMLWDKCMEPEIKFNNFICIDCQVHLHLQTINSTFLIGKS